MLLMLLAVAVCSGDSSGVEVMSEVMEVDVAWAGTPISSARAALEWVHVGPGDVLVDLGCGDGRVALEAAQLGAHAVCIERDFDLYVHRNHVESTSVPSRLSWHPLFSLVQGCS